MDQNQTPSTQSHIPSMPATTPQTPLVMQPNLLEPAGGPVKKNTHLTLIIAGIVIVLVIGGVLFASLSKTRIYKGAITSEETSFDRTEKPTEKEDTSKLESEPKVTPSTGTPIDLGIIREGDVAVTPKTEGSINVTVPETPRGSDTSVDVHGVAPQDVPIGFAGGEPKEDVRDPTTYVGETSTPAVDLNPPTYSVTPLTPPPPPASPPGGGLIGPPLQTPYNEPTPEAVPPSETPTSTVTPQPAPRSTVPKTPRAPNNEGQGAPPPPPPAVVVAPLMTQPPAPQIPITLPQLNNEGQGTVPLPPASASSSAFTALPPPPPTIVAQNSAAASSGASSPAPAQSIQSEIISSGTTLSAPFNATSSAPAEQNEEPRQEIIDLSQIPSDVTDVPTTTPPEQITTTVPPPQTPAPQEPSRLHGAYIQGDTGPEIMLYPAFIAAANGLYYLARKRRLFR